MACKYIYKGTTYNSREEFLEYAKENIIKESSENKFMQLLEKDANWVKFFISAIIQDSAKKGYEKVLFPSGNTASKVEGHSTLEEFKKQKEDRIKELEEQNKDKELYDEYGNKFEELDFLKKERIENNNKEINQLKRELERVETEGFGALKPIFNFYENTVTNILKKQGYNPTLITDEYGNTWNEITIDNKRDESTIFFQRDEKGKVIKIETEEEAIDYLIQNNVLNKNKHDGKYVIKRLEKQMNPIGSNKQLDGIRNVQGKNINFIKRLNAQFNKKYQIDLYTITPKGNAYYVKVVPLAIEFLRLKHLQINSNNEIVEEPIDDLNKLIISWLNSKGISVDAIEQIKTRTGGEANAFADLVNKTVKFVAGKLKADTLPEEAGHFFMAMLGKDNPLYKKYMLLASKSNMLKKVKEDYKDIYTTEEDFVFETAGKLLAKAIVNNFKNEENISLINALINTAKLILLRIKHFIKPNDAFIVEQLIEKEFSNASNYILKDTLEQDKFLNKNLKEKQNKDNYYQLTSDEEILLDIVKKSTKRLEHKLELEKHKKNQDTDILLSLQETFNDLNDNQNVEGFIKFIEQARKDINYTYLKYKKIIDSNYNVSLSEMKELRNHILTYDVIDEFIKHPYKDPRLRNLVAYVQNSFLNDSKEASILNKKEYIKTIFKQQALIKVSDFLYEYGKINPALTPEIIKNQLLQVEGDINFAITYFDTVGDSKDVILALTGKAIRDAKDLVRIHHIDYKNRILKAVEDYEKETGESGLKIFEGLYDTDDNGNPTGDWVNEIDGQFYIDKLKLRRNLEKKHPDNPQKVNELLKTWQNQYITYSIEGRLIHPKYSKNMTKLMKNKPKYKLYKALRKIMNEVTNELPDSYFIGDKLPQIRRKLGERIRSNVKNSGSLIKNTILDSVTVREDDIEYGLMDESGKPINTVPIYYTAKLFDQHVYDEAFKKFKDKAIKDGLSEDESIKVAETKANDLAYAQGAKDLNLDLASTISDFARMAINFREMYNIKDNVETVIELLGERKALKKKFGKVVVNPLTNEPLYEEGITTNAFDMLKQYVDVQMYGQEKAESKTVDFLGYEIDLGKMADLLNKYTALNGLALNVFSAFSNISIGKIYRIMESIAGQYFNKKSLLKADGIYFTNIHEVFSKDIGKRKNSSKLGLWNEFFDVLQNYNTEQRNFKAYNKNVFQRLFKVNNLFFLNSSGEHYIQSITSLATAQEWKTEDGKTVNIWEDAYVENGKLKFKTLTDKELKRFTDISKGINQSLDGVYNDVDKVLAQRYAVGRLALLFRKFIFPGFMKRFKSKRFNYRLETLEEGMYTSTGRFIYGLFKDLRNKKFSVYANWNSLESYEKNNIKRTSYEVLVMISLAVLANSLEDWEDDDKFNQFMIYEINRVYAEMAFFHNPNEGLKILKSPAAAVTSIQSVQGLLGLCLQPWNWTERYERGNRAGDLKIGAKFIDILPVVNKINDWQDIDRQIDYIK